MNTPWTKGFNRSTVTRVMKLGMLLNIVAGLLPSIVIAGVGVGGQSYSLSSGSFVRQMVSIEPGEGLVAHLMPSSNSTGSTRFEVWVDGVRIERISGRKHELLRWNLPFSVGMRLTAELRYICRTKTCQGTAQWQRSTAQESPAPVLTPYVNQRAFRAVSGNCLDASNSATTDGLCMCSDAAAAMAMTLAGGQDVGDERELASAIFESTVPSRIPYGGAAVVGALIEELSDSHGLHCQETKSSNASFEETLKNAVRAGDAVLFRSKAFSTPGHYVSVVGFKKITGDLNLIVNDPFGRWRSKDSWELNSTSPSSAKGARVVYPLSSLRSTASIVVCTQ